MRRLGGNQVGSRSRPAQPPCDAESDQPGDKSVQGYDDNVHFASAVADDHECISERQYERPGQREPLNHDHQRGKRVAAEREAASGPRRCGASGLQGRPREDQPDRHIGAVEHDDAYAAHDAHGQRGDRQHH